MRNAPRLILIHGRNHAHASKAAARDVVYHLERGEEGRTSLGALLVMLPVALGCVLLAKPMFYSFHWSSVLYVFGATVCFLVAARWLAQMRDSPCLSSL